MRKYKRIIRLAKHNKGSASIEYAMIVGLVVNCIIACLLSVSALLQAHFGVIEHALEDPTFADPGPPGGGGKNNGGDEK